MIVKQSSLLSWAPPSAAERSEGRAVRSSLFARPCGLPPLAALLPSLARSLVIILLFWGIFFGQSQGLHAQTFPVTSIVQVSSFSPQLETYDDPGRVVVTLISTDDRPEYEVLLRFTLSGPGFSIRSREDFLPFPVVLQRNVPLVLTGAQLRDYFDPLNLNFGGPALDNILSTGGLLNEGPVSLCVEVFDYNRFFDPPVSNTGCATGLMRLQRPPILLEPGSEVVQSFPQQVRFGWQPQHAGVAVRYTLEVYEDILPGMGDNLIIDNTQPLFVKTTSATFSLTTSLDPLFQVGSRYLVRVRAEDIMGQAAFLNDGWSDIYSFVYLAAEDPPASCPEPSGLIGEALDANNLQISWQPDALVASWLIIDPNNDSIPLPDSTHYYQAENLLPSTTYVYQFCAICTDGSSRCEKVVIDLPADSTANPCGPALLAQSQPLDDHSLLISWNEVTAATGYTLRWGVLSANNTTPTPSPPRGESQPANRQEDAPLNNQLERAPNLNAAQTLSASPVPFVYTDSLNLAAGSSEATLEELSIGSSYQIELCKSCPDGSIECFSWTEAFNGLDDDCLIRLDLTRTDSTDTSLSLAWTFDPQDLSVDSTFTLLWQLADGTEAADTAVLPYTAGSYTITNLEAFRTYELRICAECTAGQSACRELAPFGGCPADYDPCLEDLEQNNALLAWLPELGDSLRPTKARFKPRVALRWDSLTVGNNLYFDLAQRNLIAQQITEAHQLSNKVTYVAQIQTQCADSIWSDWSAPVLFNIACAVDDSLWLENLTDTSVLIAGLAQANAVNYSFEYRQVGQDNWTIITNLTHPLLDVQNLLPETEYELRLRYWCSEGVWSDYTTSFFFTTLPPCNPPFRITVDPILTDAAQLNWTPYAAAVQTELRYRPQLSGFFYLSMYPPPWQSAAVADSLLFLSELTGGATYSYQLRSDCGVNRSEWTSLDHFDLLCAPPDDILVSNITYESAIAQLIDLPPATQSSQLEYRTLGDSTWQLLNTTYGYASLQNLDDLTYYELRASATCYSGEVSEYSDTVQFRTPVKCLVPENLRVDSLQPFSAQLNWDVTGTIEEWEVLVYGPMGPLQMTNVAPANVGGINTIAPGNPASGRGGSPGDDRQEAPSDNPTNNPEPGSVSSNPVIMNPVGIGSVFTPQPYAGWQRFTVTEPTKLLSELRQNTEYLVVIRANCPEFGWTDYTDTLFFRSLTDCRPPINLVAEAIYQTTVQTSWTPINAYAEEYQVDLESLEPLSLSGTNIQINMQEGITPGNESGGGPNSFWRHTEQQLAIYRDSVVTPDLTAPFSGLRPNTEYRFRVKSRCDNFGWTGYSDWLVFRTDHCIAPSEIIEEALDRSTMQISWQPSNGVNSYEFKYKLADDPGADWLMINTSDSVVVLDGLLSNQIYDYRITEVCQGNAGLRPAPQDSFLMERPSLNNGFYLCGQEGEVDLSNQTPLASLLEGDTIIAFDFPIIITMASGSGGYFSGTGDIRMPYFNKAKFSFTFDDIFVNDDYRMVGGYLEAMGFGVEVLPPWADSLLSDVMELLELADSVLTAEQLGQLNDLLALGANANMPPELLDQIEDVVDCYTQATTPAQTALCDDLLDSVLVAVNAFLDERYDADFQVVFQQNDNQQFGFDAKGSQEPEHWYEKKTIAEADYWIAYKSVKEGIPDLVNGVTLVPGTLDSVAFSQPSGAPLPVSISADTASITFVGQPGEEYFLAAEQLVGGDSVPNNIAGLLRVVPYPELPLEVVLVPLSASAVNGINAATIEQGIRSILGQAVVNPTVTRADVFTALGYDGILDAVGSGLLTNYSPEMRDIINAYENGPGVEDNKYYLFLADNYETTTRAGFMPRGRQFGFIYLGNAGAGDALSRTIAHELAHGAYVLKHTFDAYPGELPQNSTDNLMDYAGGQHLYKWQWDLIHDPVSAPILPGDGSGESNTLNQLVLLENLRNDDGTYTFISPAGRPITLPGNVQSVTFNTGDNIGVKEECFSGFDIYVFGSLRAFTLSDGVTYSTYLNCDNTGDFYGYGYKDSTSAKVYYRDTLSKNLPSGNHKVIYVVPQSQNNAPGWVAKSRTWYGISFYDNDVLNDSIYRAQGERKEFDFLAETIYGDGGEVINLQNNDPLSEEAKQLLAIAAAWPGTSIKAMMYAYTHAHQMSRYPLANGNCRNDELTGIDYLALQLKLKELYENERINNNSAPYSFNFNETPSLIISKEEVAAWRTATESIYERYDRFYRDTIASQVILDYTNDADGAAGLILLLEFWKDYPCLIETLSLEERLHILEVLKHGDLNTEWLWGVFGAEHQGLYNTILGVTKPHEYQAVIDLYAQNGYGIYDTIHSKFDDAAYDYFVGCLANMVIQRRSFETEGLMARHQEFTQNGSILTYYTVGVDASNPTASAISIVHTIDAFVEDPQAYFGSALGNINGEFQIVITTGRYPSTRTLQRSQGSPFDPVALKFSHDVTFGLESPSPIAVQAGQTLVVPLCLAELLFRNYRDAEWDREFKSFITVVAIAGAATSIVFTGGTSAGVVFAVLATVDAAVATTVYALSDDAYSWETTGDGTLDQAIHQTINQIATYVGIANIAGLVTYGGGKLIFNFKEIKTAINQIRTHAPAKLADFQNELKELYRLIKQYGLNGITDPNLIQVENQLRAEIATMRLNDLVSTNVPSSIHLKSTLYAVAVRDGNFINLGTGQMIDEIYHMKPNLWLSTPPGSGKMIEVTNIHYLDLLGNRQYGKLTFYEDVSNPNVWRCFPETFFVPFADEFADFFILFNQKNWNWDNYFTPQARTYISSLDETNRTLLLNAFDSWRDSRGFRFAKIFNDLAENLYINGFTDNAVQNIINKIVTEDLGVAIDEAIKLSGNPDLVRLRGQYSELKRKKLMRIISFENSTVAQNQQRVTLVNVLPANIIGTGGLSEAAIQSAVGKVINGNLGDALADVMEVNINLERQRIVINLRGQYQALTTEFEAGIIHYEQYVLTRNQIRAGFIESLPISPGIGGLTENVVQSIHTKIISGNNLGEAIDDAIRFNTDENLVNMFINLRSQYTDLLMDWNRNFVSYENFSLIRNQIRNGVLESLPPVNIADNPGLTPDVLQNIRDKIALGDLEERIEAFDDAIRFNNNPALHNDLLNQKARYMEMSYDYSIPRMGFEEFQVTENNIIDGFLRTLIN